MIKQALTSKPLVLRLRRRRRERGAAVFVVVMVITLLLGIGVLAARSASLGTAASGSERQMTQTHYMTEYAMLLAVAKVAPDPQNYITRATDPNFPDYGMCMGQKILTAPLSRPSCYRLGYNEVQEPLALNGHAVLTPYSLGSPTIEGHFWVELTDVTNGAISPPGMLANPGAQNPQFYDVTATSIAQVRTKNTLPGGLDATASGSQSTEMSRAFLRVGPL